MRRRFDTTLAFNLTLDMWMDLECLSKVDGDGNKGALVRDILEGRYPPIPEAVERLDHTKRQRFEELLASLTVISQEKQ